jgi:hypothetical protein
VYIGVEELEVKKNYKIQKRQNFEFLKERFCMIIIFLIIYIILIADFCLVMSRLFLGSGKCESVIIAIFLLHLELLSLPLVTEKSNRFNQ